MARSRVKSKSDHDVAHLHPLTNFPTKCQLSTPYGFRDIAWTRSITHLAMEIHFQTTDHVVAVEKVVEQHIATKYSKCNSLRVILSHMIILGKSAITQSKVGQDSPNPTA